MCEDAVKVEWIPAHLQKDSEAKVDVYFDSRIVEGKNGVLVSFFRGRELVRLAKTGDPNAEIFITEEFYNELKAKGGVPQKDDILITAVGTLGKVYVVQGNQEVYCRSCLLCMGIYVQFVWIWRTCSRWLVCRANRIGKKKPVHYEKVRNEACIARV